MDAAGKPIEKRVNHCTTIASLGGATMDSELAVRRQAPPRADHPNLDWVAITTPRASIRAQAWSPVASGPS